MEQTPDCFVEHAFKFQDGVLTDLEPLPGGANSQAFWINAQGLIVGMAQNGEVDPLLGIQELHAVGWKNGKIFELGTLGGNESLAQAVNDRGQVVGIALNTIPDPISFIGFVGTQMRAFLSENGVMQDLGSLGGPDAWARYINNRGQVAGVSFTDSTINPASGLPTTHPFFWQNGNMTDLGTFGGIFAEPEGLNSRGQVVGGSTIEGDVGCNGSIDSCDFHAFLWEKGSLKDLGTLGGTFGFAEAVNDSGEIVGSASNQNDQAILAFVWKNDVMTGLGALNGDDCSIAKAINSRGQIVGTSFPCAVGVPGENAALWENGSAIDLNSFVPPSSDLHLTGDDIYINDRGEIAGTAIRTNGDIRAFVLIPCDENHPNVEGCDYTLADGNVTADVTQGSNIRSPVTNLPGAIFARHSRIQREMLSGPQERMAPQFRNSSAALLSAPHNLTASPLNTYQIRINWQEASGQNQTGFNIYRCHGCPSPRNEGTKIASVGASVFAYTDGSSTSPLTEITTYTYQVTAFSATSQSGPSNASSATTKTEPAPTNLFSYAEVEGRGTIVFLRWTNNSTDDNSYFVESCTGLTCTNFSVIAQLGANATADVRGFPFQYDLDVTIRYRVRAHSPGGFSAYSNIRNQALP